MRPSLADRAEHLLTPLLLGMAPLAVIAFILLCFIDEVPLKTTIERDIVHGSSDAPAPEQG